MSTMNCQSIRREVEAAAPGDLLSSTANHHLQSCGECGTFRDEEWKLRALVASLGTVKAPGDFDFRLRARLANENRRGPVAMQRFTLGFRSVAVAALLLLIGAVVVFVNFRNPNGSQPNGSQLASQSAPATSTAATEKTTEAKLGSDSSSAPVVSSPALGVDLPAGSTVAVKSSSSLSTRQSRSLSRSRVAALATVRDPGSIRTRDLASTPATVLRPAGSGSEKLWSSAFPIDASYQSLKVSVDDGRGSSRTISLPSVSFGSQRMLSQGATPFLVTNRGSW